MSPKDQKGKGGKRPRAWHHGPNEDRRFEEAISRLDQHKDVSVDGHPTKETPTQKDAHND
jgi:hypothetical protein